jgi:hypothetical protein
VELEGGNVGHILIAIIIVFGIALIIYELSPSQNKHKDKL